MKNIILVYPAYERGGVKINFLNYINVLKKKSVTISINGDILMIDFLFVMVLSSHQNWSQMLVWNQWN